MIRLFFPRIDFSGRMSRGAFWRELAVAALTTPIVFGLLTYLINEFSVATAQGLAVDDAQAKVLAGLLLSGVGLRNTVAFAGIFKRRMNDVGYGAIDFRRDSRPLLVAAAILFVMAMGLSRQLSVILLIPLFYIVFWQIRRLFGFVFRLTVSSSQEGAEPTAMPWRQEVQDSAWPGIAAQLQGNNWKEQPSMKLLTALGEELSRVGRDQKTRKIWGEMKSAASNAPALAQFESVRRWLDQPVVAGGEDRADKLKSTRARGSERRKPAVYRSPPTNAVRMAHSLPKHGRSSFLSGLLRGPWG